MTAAGDSATLLLSSSTGTTAIDEGIRATRTMNMTASSVAMWEGRYILGLVDGSIVVQGDDGGAIRAGNREIEQISVAGNGFYAIVGGEVVFVDRYRNIDRLREVMRHLPGNKVRLICNSIYRSDSMYLATVDETLNNAFIFDMVNKRLIFQVTSSVFESTEKRRSYQISSIANIEVSIDQQYFAILTLQGMIAVYDYKNNLIPRTSNLTRSNAAHVAHIPNSMHMAVVAGPEILFVKVDTLIVTKIFATEYSYLRVVLPVFNDKLLVVSADHDVGLYLLDDICPLRCTACKKDPTGDKRECILCEQKFEVVEGSCVAQSTYSCENSGKKYWHYDACIEKCPPGTFGLTGICESCSNTCLTCTQDSPGYCTSCLSGKVLSSRGQCQDTCGSGQLLNQTLNRCEFCGSNCLECLGSGKCTKCDFGMVFDEYSNKCYHACNEGTFLNSVSGQCSPCHSSCEACFGVSPISCTKCKPGKYLSNRACVDECPKGTFKETKLRACPKCAQNCKACSSASICDDCEDGYYINSTSQACQPSCSSQDGFYIQDGKYCNACASPCITCDQHACTSCLAGHELSGGSCWPSGRLQTIKAVVLVSIAGLLVVVAAVVVWRVRRWWTRPSQANARQVFELYSGDNPEKLPAKPSTSV